MTDFHDEIFPLTLAFGASGGPQRQTDITPTASGAEVRNTSRAHSRRRYNAGAGLKSLDDMHRLIAFFEARLGQLYSFRFKDPMDHKSCLPSQTPGPDDQVLGQGDAETTQFQLVKHYRDSSGGWTRRITKPKAGSVLMSVNGTLQAADSYIVDTLSIIAAGFTFDVPVRFDSDSLDLTLEAFGAGEVANIPLVEVRDRMPPFVEGDHA